MEIEKRAYMHAPELRAADNGNTLRGYAAVFNSETDIAGQFREVIAPGAFAQTIKGDIRALFDHDPGRVLGRTKSGTLRLDEDERGLAVEIDLPNTSEGRDLAELVKRGDIDGMSFGFRVTHDEWEEGDDMPRRTIRGVDLFEVSAVTFPAYGDTELALRSRDKAKEKTTEEEREAEKARAAYAARKAEQEQKFRKI